MRRTVVAGIGADDPASSADQDTRDMDEDEATERDGVSGHD